jgi:hypothetical protein
VRAVVYFRDGQSLYVAQDVNGSPAVSLLAATDLHLLSTAPDIPMQGISTEVEESDETNMVFGLGNRGVSILDTTQPVTSTGPGPVFANAPAVTPGGGVNTGGTAITLSGQNFGANPVVRVGTQNAAVASNSSTQVQATSPASTASGAVNITAHFSNGATTLAPDGTLFATRIPTWSKSAIKTLRCYRSLRVPD